MIVKKTNSEIQLFINKWTKLTTIFVCILCFPIVIASEDVLSAYVGGEYKYLCRWLQLWCFFLIFQMHSTPAYSFVIAKGRTKALVVAAGVSSIISIVINILLCKSIPVGSAVIGYAVYLVCLICVDYIFIYKYYMNLRRVPILKSFLFPLFIGVIGCILIYNIPFPWIDISSIKRINFFIMFAIKSCVWLFLYFCLLFAFRILEWRSLKKILKSVKEK